MEEGQVTASAVGSPRGEEAAAAFRVHRHDVLNYLQLVRAYIQMNRPERALEAVTELTLWLQSLSAAQSAFETIAPPLLWTAAACSHVRLGRAEAAVRWTPVLCELVSSVWRWADEAAAAAGLRGAVLDLVDGLQAMGQAAGWADAQAAPLLTVVLQLSDHEEAAEVVRRQFEARYGKPYIEARDPTNNASVRVGVVLGRR
ncbi:Spo0B domain-containing protein [Alicyclobacillus cycloheptanicus]|uniref:SpoOB alpha-helical domain-containing protein n=1 Tax=Alicyclobacillus cycloheptanicus TaxID=1457 RepID=A0ABT9XET5_9BACL|nr:Spo0B domain-containing protein [Alicyclobacillus cycloheptanicus]MDQ0188328.1 hypothetical protein [Alicyclobacillus cycloheptanicus]WDM01042.1 Spo0B domain-containing protein [Alicyclobacillus cycloheptanicus]